MDERPDLGVAPGVTSIFTRSWLWLEVVTCCYLASAVLIVGETDGTPVRGPDAISATILAYTVAFGWIRTKPEVEAILTGQALFHIGAIVICRSRR